VRRETPAPPLVRAGRGFDACDSLSIQKQSPPGLRLAGFIFEYWWRRRESNPRPQALYRQFYILSTII
jgi:hypothetical protein